MNIAQTDYALHLILKTVKIGDGTLHQVFFSSGTVEKKQMANLTRFMLCYPISNFKFNFSSICSNNEQAAQSSKGYKGK